MAKHSGRFVAYFRVSTTKQGVHGLGIEAQKEAVERYLNGGRWELVAERVEVESGKRNDRPALAEALRLCRVHRATLIIAKLDRLARNVHFISELMESEVDFVAVDFPEANRLTVHILAAVAEHEARMISERTKAALAVKAAQLAKEGKRLGKQDPHFIKAFQVKASKLGAEVRRKKAEKRAADLLPIIEDMRSRGIKSLKGMAKELNWLRVEAPRGGQWRAMQVWHLLKWVKSSSELVN